MAKSLPVENLLPQNVGSIINYLKQLPKQPNGELLVAGNHNQLRTISSETVDPIDWSHPPPYTGQYPLSSTNCTMQCALQITRLAALSQPRTCDFRMPDQRTAGAATQGIGQLLFLLPNAELRQRVRNFERFYKRYISAKTGILFNKTCLNEGLFHNYTNICIYKHMYTDYIYICSTINMSQ